MSGMPWLLDSRVNLLGSGSRLSKTAAAAAAAMERGRARKVRESFIFGKGGGGGVGFGKNECVGLVRFGLKGSR